MSAGCRFGCRWQGSRGRASAGPCASGSGANGWTPPCRRTCSATARRSPPPPRTCCGTSTAAPAPAPISAPALQQPARHYGAGELAPHRTQYAPSIPFATLTHIQLLRVIDLQLRMKNISGIEPDFVMK